MFGFKKIIFFCFLLIIALAGCTSSYNKNVAIINNKEFKLELARTDEEAYKGLSFRENLCANCGMLFIFPEARKRTFVMRNMLISLDIIFIKDNRIINIHKNLKPEGKNYKGRYSSSEDVNYVLEINAGASDNFGIKEGDEILINLAE